MPDGFCAKSSLFYFDQKTSGGIERRYLATLPTPKQHAMRALPSFQDATGITPLTRDQWPDHVFESRQTTVPILDQDGEGKCTCSAGTRAAMIVRARNQMSFVMLSDDSMYTWINGGSDSGSNAGDLVQAAAQYGWSTPALVPQYTLSPPGYSDVAKTMALNYRLRADGYCQITSVEEAVTAVINRWQLIFDVQAGARYATDSINTVSYLGRWTNHEQNAGEGLRIVNNQAQLLGSNSWGLEWGDQGYGWFTENHLTGADTIFAFNAMCSSDIDPYQPPVPKRMLKTFYGPIRPAA
jgi:hypothetical protein